MNIEKSSNSETIFGSSVIYGLNLTNLPLICEVLHLN